MGTESPGARATPPPPSPCTLVAGAQLNDHGRMGGRTGQAETSLTGPFARRISRADAAPCPGQEGVEDGADPVTKLSDARLADRVGSVEVGAETTTKFSDAGGAGAESTCTFLVFLARLETARQWPRMRFFLTLRRGCTELTLRMCSGDSENFLACSCAVRMLLALRAKIVDTNGAL